MCSVLAGANNPVDFLCCRIVAADHFGAFRSEPELPANKREAMGAAQRAEVDCGQCLLIRQVDNSNRVE